jgi:hypothetical protein
VDVVGSGAVSLRALTRCLSVTGRTSHKGGIVHGSYRRGQRTAASAAYLNKLQSRAPRPSAALVHSRARACVPLMAPMGGERAPWREGYRVTSVDGHCLEASAHRRNALREAPGRAWPGKALVVSAPAHGLVTEVLPCQDGQAQARSRLGAVLATVAADALGIADRHVCTRTWLGAMATRGGFLVLRPPQGGPCELFSPLQSAERTPPGHIAQPTRVGGGGGGRQAPLTAAAAHSGARAACQGPPAPHPNQCSAPEIGQRGGAALPEALHGGARLPSLRGILSFRFHRDDERTSRARGAILYAMPMAGWAAIVLKLAQGVCASVAKKAQEPTASPLPTSSTSKKGTYCNSSMTHVSTSTVGHTLTWLAPGGNVSVPALASRKKM